MTFMNALRHTTINYGARRPRWPDNAYVMYDHNDAELRWTHTNNPAPLLGTDPATAITAEDIQATDWEVV